MNLVELDKLINSLNPKTDKDLIIFYKKKRKDLITNISSKINKELKSNKYANGGGIDEQGIDLFENYKNIPKSVQKILDKYDEDFEDGNYKGLEKALKDLKKIGYTFEYGLDGGAYDLRPIGTKGKSEFSQYAKGGSVERENTEMVLNNNKQISHHTKELASAVKGKKVPAWVVAKVNRSASDLSDATHYLDGSKYAKGGTTKGYSYTIGGL